MSTLITSIEHAFATVAKDIVTGARFVTQHVLPLLQRVEASEQMIEAITGLVSPQAANIERVAFAILGQAIKATQDAETAAQAGGLNLQLDAQLVADLKSIIPSIVQGAKAVTPAVVPPVVPAAPHA